VLAVIRRSLDLISSKLRTKGLKVEFSSRKRCIAVIDKEVLMQICLNLILNAVDAMSSGMLLRLEAEYFEDDWVKIVIANEGEKIPDDIRPRIFDPFFTTKKSGTGLGLSITQRLVREAAGEICLVDSEDETVFQILLPVSANFMR